MTPEISSAVPANSPRSTADRQQLDRALAHGIAWTGLAKWASQVLSWGCTLFIARILTPADFGLMGMATMYTGLVQLVNEFGLGSAIVRDRTLTDDHISALGGLSVGLGASLCLLSLPLAFPLGWFFHEPALRPVIAVLGLTFLTSSVKVLPRSLLTRELRFREVALLDALEAGLGSLLTLAFAIAGYRYWAMVLGALLASLISALAMLRRRPHPLAWPRRWATVSHSVRFGQHLVISRLAWYLYSNADFAVVGRVLGKVVLGAYSLGWTIASIPVSRISALVGQVIPAVLARVQHDQAELRRYLFLLTEGLAFVTFPLSVGAFLVAGDFVHVALGDKWAGAVLPLKLLSVYAAVRSVSAVFSQLLVAVGRSRVMMRISIFALLVLPPLFYVGTRWGAAGVAAAWIVGYPLVMAPTLQQVFEVTGATLRGYFGALWPALASSLLMGAAVLAARALIPTTWPAPLHLALEVAAGAIAYGLILLALFRKHVEAYWTVLRNLKG
jgi:PST family polysaccharide transporter